MMEQAEGHRVDGDSRITHDDFDYVTPVAFSSPSQGRQTVSEKDRNGSVQRRTLPFRSGHERIPVRERL